MKKSLSIILTLALILSMVAFGGSISAFADSGSETETVDSTSGDDNTIKLGCLYSLTGATAEAGALYKVMLELCVDIINNKWDDINVPFAATEGIPSMGGAKIELVWADFQASPEVGMAEAERLITEEGVDILFGAHYSSVAKTVMTVAQRYGIPFICPEATSAALTDGSIECDWIFRTTPSDATFVEDIFKYFVYLNENFDADIKTVAFACENDEMGALAQVEMQKNAPIYGFDVVEDISYSLDTTNVTSEVLRLKAADPDALIMVSFAPDAVLMQNTFKEMDFCPKIIVGNRAGHVTQQFLDLGEDSQYVHTTNIYSKDLSDSSPIIAQISEMFEERSGGIAINGDNARTFAGIFMLCDALERAGTKEPEALRKALQETDITFDGDTIVTWEGIKFDEHGQNTLASGIITQIIDGEHVTVYPEAFASQDPVYPIPAWSER